MSEELCSAHDVEPYTTLRVGSPVMVWVSSPPSRLGPNREISQWHRETLPMVQTLSVPSHLQTWSLSYHWVVCLLSPETQSGQRLSDIKVKEKFDSTFL